MIVGRKFDRLRKVSFSGCKCYLHLNTDFQVTEMVVKKLHWDCNYGHESLHWYCITTCVDPDPLMVIDYINWHRLLLVRGRDLPSFLKKGTEMVIMLHWYIQHPCGCMPGLHNLWASEPCEPWEKKRVLWNCKCMKNVSGLVPRFYWRNICRVKQYWLSDFHCLGLSTQFTD